MSGNAGAARVETGKVRAWLRAGLLGLVGVVASRAGCAVSSPPGSAPPTDAVAQLLAASGRCPENVLELRALLETAGARLEPALVANRGFHNPSQGSFSLFETVTGRLRGVDFELARGDLVFGHFTAAGGAGSLVLDQEPRAGALMIELVSWDPAKGLYDFYELIGDGTRGRWFYRGDSADVLADLVELWLGPEPGKPRFGTRLRCSGCHMHGGPIMKEVAPPYNDWWRRRRVLPLGGLVPDRELGAIMAGLVDASVLWSGVRGGLERLVASPGFRRVLQGRSLRERLRPVFAPVEVNLDSDDVPVDSTRPWVSIPSAFFVDPWLASAPLRLDRGAYLGLLAETGTRFPESGGPDADHAWLTPIKGFGDRLLIEAAIADGLVDSEWVADVLAVDLERPFHSPTRAALLRLLPEHAAPGWQGDFVATLERSALPGAAELAQNLRDPERDLGFHRRTARESLARRALELGTDAGRRRAFTSLVALRTSVFDLELSKNPRGQILEPGFRVIFPESSR